MCIELVRNFVRLEILEYLILSDVDVMRIDYSILERDFVPGARAGVCSSFVKTNFGFNEMVFSSRGWEIAGDV